VIRLVNAEEGTPVGEGATLTLREKAEFKTPQPVDERGRGTLKVPRGASYVCVLCRKDGYVTTAVTWESPDQKTAVDLPAEFTVKLPKGKTISGRVVDDAGKPVKDATVTVSSYRRDRDEQTPTEMPVVRPFIPWEKRMTDAEGRWSYGGADPVAAEIRVHAQHPDFARDTKDFDGPPIQSLFDGSAVTILERGVDVTGTVTDSKGTPIAGARVTTVENNHVVNDYGVTSKSDASGKFRLAHVRTSKAATLTVSAKGHGPEMISVDVGGGDGPPAPVAIVLPDARTIRGRVLDPEGKPVAGATVLARDWRNKSSISLRAKADAEGKFAIADAPADEVRFHVFKDGYTYRVGVPLKAGAPDDEEGIVVTLMPEGRSTGL
jgi:uncharacterized GH25 family protein